MRLARFVKKIYTNCKTIVRAKDNSEVEISIKRGVKQSDPMSPLLFNLILDPIIEKISKETRGVQVL